MKRKVHGEGNYQAAREYDRKLRRHVDSADIEAEARRAAPRTKAEAEELERAEAKGKQRRREEDPALKPKGQRAQRSAAGQSRDR
jgi:hypothetical protein